MKESEEKFDGMKDGADHKWYGASRQEAEQLMASIRGQLIMGKALYYAIERLKGLEQNESDTLFIDPKGHLRAYEFIVTGLPEWSDRQDMEFLMWGIYPIWSVVEESRPRMADDEALVLEPMDGGLIVSTEKVTPITKHELKDGDTTNVTPITKHKE